MTLILNGTDNSATVPAVQGGTAGTSTGEYFPATNQWAVATAGTQAVFVNASQQVGIGTTTLNARFNVNGSVMLTNGAGAGSSFYPYYNSSTSYNAIGSDTNGGLTFITGVGAPAIRATISNVGYLNVPYQPAFEVTSSGVQSWSGASNYQTLTLGNRLSGSSNRYGGYNTSTYRFTAPVAGIYFFYTQITPITASTGPEQQLWVNGSIAGRIGAIAYNYYTISSGYFTNTANQSLSLAVGDYVELKVVNYNNVAVDLDLSRCIFGGFLLG